MSPLGVQELPRSLGADVSALPRKLSRLSPTGAAANGQNRTKCGAAKVNLFNHLISTGLQRLRDR